MTKPLILIPVYEGATSVAEVVRGARVSGCSVLVIDDGSSDGSGRAAEAAGAAVLRHPSNRGKGAALATGFAYAARTQTSGVLTLDADLQHDPAEIPLLLAAHHQNPEALVVGIRNFAEMPRRSQVGNRISTWWISRFSGRPVGDSQSGFRVYPRALFAGRPLRTRRFDSETELILRAAKLNLPLIEVPIRTVYQNGQRTHFHNWQDSLRILKLVVTSPWWE